MTRAAAGSGPRGDRPGLQAERTLLSWDRTAAALLANGALLLVRDLRGSGTGALVPAVLALAVMFVVAVLGRRRARRLSDPDARGRPARRELAVAGVGVVAVGVAVLVVLVLGAASG